MVESARKKQVYIYIYIYMVFPSDAFEMNIATDAMG